jgi:thiosulfate/3-mercaptopyruvate sulfurtransferase
MRDPKVLIDTAELAAALGDPKLRVYDCTTDYVSIPVRFPYTQQPLLAASRRHWFEDARIPGADYLDLVGEFSDPATPRDRIMMAPTPQLEAAFSRHGVGAGTRVVLYSWRSMMWATRFWWMLKALGFDNAAVLDGDFNRWGEEGGPVESGPARGFPPAAFTAAPRPGLVADKAAVLAALGRSDTVIVNALDPRFHDGRTPSRYGRSGRIPGSVNVPAVTLVDAESKFVPLDDAAAKFRAAGVTREKRVICYCGDGVSATINLFLLYQLGYDDLALYDGSMGEWAPDPDLPIETSA